MPWPGRRWPVEEPAEGAAGADVGARGRRGGHQPAPGEPLVAIGGQGVHALDQRPGDVVVGLQVREDPRAVAEAARTAWAVAIAWRRNAGSPVILASSVPSQIMLPFTDA